MKKFEHLGHEVIVQRGQDSFLKHLKENKIDYRVLPIVNFDYLVLTYEKNGVKKYAVEECNETHDDAWYTIYITDTIPEDGWDGLRKNARRYDIINVSTIEPLKPKSYTSRAAEIALEHVNEKKSSDNFLEIFANCELTDEDYQEIKHQLSFMRIERMEDAETFGMWDIDKVFLERVFKAK